ncbi:hypothetical protein N7520_001387 [Penicillium odoratum]|uniref:uncharacterized protein n=1 Tax=Penicillium odoratum TaxID=1167516 RepID=UPI0025484455|nr:uncharacterized protein N7520_001387 [Penicillium odoratum]KAJ5778141.1 hypothetical protein N7520_001387 [Penicillium odoratum]
MSFQEPVEFCKATIPGLGTVDGLEYANGVQQFCGIPYAHLSKRWTRSTLRMSWEGGHHDGTKLGNDCPSPIVEGDDADDLVPVPPPAHFSDSRVVDEKSALVMNIVIPHSWNPDKSYPVFVYVHGGSLLYGGANLPIFDAVNLVSHSISIDLPIVCINFNYRVGIGGFLAGKIIADELREDGHAGSGNFGFTDQQVALEWVQRYVQFFGGDPHNVTAVGESAGGISISNQLLAANPSVFHRAVCMSGLSAAIPAWTIEQHDRFFEAVCRHFEIDLSTPEALDQLRSIPQQELANATPAIQGVPSGTGNPCLDGWFYRSELNPRDVNSPPAWLKSYMFGDTYHEGVIFHLNLLEDDYQSVRRVLADHINDEARTAQILEAYGITIDSPQDEFLARVEHMCGDAIFKIPNYLLSRTAKQSSFFYHFDQRSRIQNAFQGTAYHAHELLYLFMNLEDEFNEEEKRMAREFSSAWIRFANGLAPWDVETGERKWMVWGPASKVELKDEVEDQEVRDYKRITWILQLDEGECWKRWLAGVDALVNHRLKLFGSAWISK